MPDDPVMPTSKKTPVAEAPPTGKKTARRKLASPAPAIDSVKLAQMSEAMAAAERAVADAVAGIAAIVNPPTDNDSSGSPDNQQPASS